MEIEEDINSIRLFFRYWYLTFISFFILIALLLFSIMWIEVGGGYNFEDYIFEDYVNLIGQQVFLSIWLSAMAQIPLYLLYFYIGFKYNDTIRNKFFKFINILYFIIVFIGLYIPCIF